MLFGVFVIAIYMCNFWNKREHLSYIINVGLWGAGSIGLLVGITNFFQLWTNMTYVIFFWCGFELRKSLSCESFYGIWLRKAPLALSIIAFAGFFVCLKALDYHEGLIFRVIRGMLQLPLHLSGSLAAIKLLQIVAEKLDWENSGLFSFISVRSLGIYLFHQQFIYISLSLLNGRVPALPNALINFIFAMVSSILIVSIMLRFKPTRFLIGEK